MIVAVCRAPEGQMNGGPGEAVARGRDRELPRGQLVHACYVEPMAVPHFDRHVFICTNRREPGNPKGDCASKGGEEIRDAFKRLLHDKGLKGKIRANAAGCLDQCARGATVVIYPEQVWYGGVRPEDVPEIVEQHLIGGVPVDRLRMK
jgi:(2Fe-2S) ferredoxin